MKRRTVLAALGCLAMPTVATAQSVTTITISSPPGTGATPVLYGMKAGIFRRYGLEIDFQKMNSGAVIVAAVSSGAVQIGGSSSVSVITAYAHGIPVQIVAGGPLYQAGSGVPYQMVLVGKTSPIRSAADLSGKTFGLSVARGDLAAMSTQAWLEQHGVDWSSVHILELPQTAMVAAIEQGRIDGMSMQSPGSTIALASGKVRMLADPFSAVGRRFSIACWFAQANWVRANPDVVQRFGSAVTEASNDANRRPAEMLPLLAAFSGTDPEVLAHAARAPFVAEMRPSDVQPLIDLMVRYKVIDQRFDAAELIAPAARR